MGREKEGDEWLMRKNKHDERESKGEELQWWRTGQSQLWTFTFSFIFFSCVFYKLMTHLMWSRAVRRNISHTERLSLLKIATECK